MDQVTIHSISGGMKIGKDQPVETSTRIWTKRISPKLHPSTPSEVKVLRYVCKYQWSSPEVHNLAQKLFSIPAP